MLEMTLADLASTVDARLDQVDEPRARVVGEVSEDSRRLQPGGLSTTIVGARADGHDYARQAIASGAVAVLAQHPVDAPAVIVDDVQDTLGGLTRHLLATRAPGATIVGITGSTGKTTNG